MESCWASSLGGCSQKISREHLISQSLFIDDEISVQGFSWCKEQPKKVSLPNLTAKILCTYHNSALSPIDDAGAHAFAATREMRRVANVRMKMKPTLWRVVRYSIDGLGIERWFLKTLINLCSGSNYPVGRDSKLAGRPTEQSVQIAYGIEKFEGKAELYSVVHVGMTLSSAETVIFTPLLKFGHVEGGLFAF